MRMCAGARPRLVVPCVALLLLALAFHPAATLICSGTTYVSGSKCCHECQPGYGMESRCDHSRDTVCQPCQSGYYNEAFNYDVCRPCTRCNERSGSEPVQVCTPKSDTVCHCRPGTEPQGGYKLGVDCSPCPPRHFSPGFNQPCKPWTDCTSTGKRTLKPASNSSDSICEDKNPPATRLPWSTQNHPALPTTARPTTAQSGTSHRPSKAPTDRPGGPVLSVILGVGLGLGLLGAMSAALILFLHHQAWRLPLATPKPPGGNSFRTPIQEEHADEHCVLAKV
ncbi:PREDICTED: tumor necrosis factor receptor superfamily member 4 [Chrysochloris asiatica]|uniref:Tumor necrosis factor receptor superfamily member 4 n=1 Tax=Chrysochloris asiatica TaxID=185453 RepID=A0A9B0TWW6_CHRAS|nr:PREDICTED: tumor necrosis factor receptor superfamily member 4 [Chrysochloris asiatica]